MSGKNDKGEDPFEKFLPSAVYIMQRYVVDGIFDMKGHEKVIGEMARYMFDREIVSKTFQFVGKDGKLMDGHFILSRIYDDYSKPFKQSKFNVNFMTDIERKLDEESRRLYLEAQKQKILPNSSLFPEKR